MATREEKAIEVLKAGGYFREALEWTWNREQFKTHLHDAAGHKVRGFGSATRHALEKAGLLRRRECFVGSTWAKEWELAEPMEARAALTDPNLTEWTIDGEPAGSAEDIIQANADPDLGYLMPPGEVEALRGAPVGAEVLLGGGAGAEFVARRVA